MGSVREDVKSAFSTTGITWLTYFAYLLAVASAGAFLLVRTYRMKRLTLLTTVLWTTVMVFALVVAVAKVRCDRYR